MRKNMLLTKSSKRFEQTKNTFLTKEKCDKKMPHKDILGHRSGPKRIGSKSDSEKSQSLRV